MNAYSPFAGRAGGEHATGDPDSSGRSRLRLGVGAAAREPLLHFLVLGLLIFAADRYFDARATRFTIDVTPAAITRLVAAYQQQYGTLPSPAQVRTLVDDEIREEVFLREGMDLGLDRDDEIVRRRIAQKFSFLRQDAAAPGEPAAADLRAWYDRHAAAYRHPAKRSFDQLYFAMDRRGEAAARRLAETQRAVLQPGKSAPAGIGDAFPGPAAVRFLTEDEVARLFGGESFARQVFGAPLGRWVGPFRSGFGWHLVRVTEQAPPAQRSFTEAQADVRADWSQEQRDARNRADYERLLARYRIRRADRP